MVVPLKDTKGITITNAFPKILDKSVHKPNKIWVDSTVNKYYSCAGHHEQKDKKTNTQIKFSAVTIKQQIKPLLRHSLCRWI